MARRVLGLLLVAMAVTQLSDVGGFVDVVTTYRIGGRGPSSVVAVLLLLGELVAGVGLFRSSLLDRRRAAGLALVVAVGWSLLGAQAFARGLVLDNCGCFGVHLAQPLRWWVLVEDVEFVALAWWTLRSSRRADTSPTPPSSEPASRVAVGR